jgi:hypothetical protein
LPTDEGSVTLWGIIKREETMRLYLAILPIWAATLCNAQGAQGSFAGSWSVVITTARGDCDKAYRYGVVVAPDGTISYGGQNEFQASGRVQPDGSVRVTISRGNQSAQGTERLSGTRGSGSWTAPGGGCAGTWRAEQRH